ncbi:MAG TPA: hypothetical protein VIE66_04610 [Methylocella sp.]|jgi:hypothetical protein
MKRLITLRKALSSKEWLGDILGGSSFATMRVLLLAAMGEPLLPDEMPIFTELTRRLEAPSEPVEELWIIAARRSGKTRAVGTLAAYLAACIDYRSVLGPGERGVLPIMAANVTQAVQAFNFIQGVFTESKRFAALVDSITADTIKLKNRIDIQIRPASFRTIRGISAIAVIAEELSMWQSDDSRNADRDILAAVRPALATTGGTLFAIGSPYSRRGEMWDSYRRYYGPDGDPAILVANGPTRLFNPTIKQSIIDRAYEKEPSIAASEWGGKFRDDLESYVSPEIVDSCTPRGVHQIPFNPAISYTAHADPSGGGQDSFALAIGHVENGVGVLDLLLERRPPLPLGGPVAVVSEFCDALKAYGLYEVTGDRFGAGFTIETFRQHGVEYRKSEMSTSDYYAGFLPILNSGMVRLLDNKRLATQLCSLERKPSRFGAKDSIGHPHNGHDDCSTVVAGLFSRIVGGTGAPALIRYTDFLNKNGEPFTGPTGHYGKFISCAVDASGKAAVLHWAGHRHLMPQLVLTDFSVGYFSEKKLAPYSPWLSMCFSACSSVKVAGLVVGIYEPSERDVVRDIGFAPIAADYVERGCVKLSAEAHEKSKSAPLGAALDFRVDRLADPLAMAALAGIVKGLHN